MRRILCLLLLIVATASAALAQAYPEFDDQFVNDFARLMTPEDAASVRTKLEALKESTGIEATVVTLESRDASDSIEDYALGLFNAWGIGDSARNDGILILLAPDERAARIQLGSAYSQDFDTVASDILQRSVLPYFRDGEYSTGMVRATEEVIDRIAQRKAANLAPELPSKTGNGWVPWAIGAIAAFLFLRRSMGRRLGDAAARWRRCPTCGRRNLSRRRVMAIRPTATMDGAWHVNTRCENCGWHEDRDERIARGSRSSRRGGGGGSFGGGRSSGGGATGRW